MIRLLGPTLINQIAAGEVVERPASAIKELVENALDAGATQIDVVLRDGGQSLIQVTDNGCGMAPQDLEMAVERHATSKIPNDDLFHISTFGFRGEALPSLGAVARLNLTSRPLQSCEAWTLRVEGGVKAPLEPSSLPPGTRVTVQDLFFATPARLKFLKSVTTERSKCQELLQQLAIANAAVGFRLIDGERQVFSYGASTLSFSPADARRARLNAIFGPDFDKNTIPLDNTREGYNITGFTGLPTWHRSSAQHQYFFVNGRPVQDRSLSSLIRIAYQDFIPKERYPFASLFLQIPLEDLDVNVHPAKTQVRFRDPGLLRGLVLSTLKDALHGVGHRTSSTLTQTALGSFSPSYQAVVASPPRSFLAPSPAFQHASPRPMPIHSLCEDDEPTILPSPSPAPQNPLILGPMGEALAQIHNSYILAQTDEGLVLVDQHAAHERLIYEKMKTELEEGQIHSDTLLIPETIEITTVPVDSLAIHFSHLQKLGLVLEIFGTSTVLVRAVPILLRNTPLPALIQDLADELKEWEDASDPTHILHKYLRAMCASVACRRSIKAGHTLSLTEMNALLRQMEATPHTGQCNHGRPTSVVLTLSDIEKLFGRH